MDSCKLVGYTVTPETFDFLHNYGFGGFKHTYLPTAFTAAAAWDNGSNSNSPSSVAMQLRQSTDDGATYTSCGAPVTLTAAALYPGAGRDLPVARGRKPCILRHEFLLRRVPG